MEERWTVGSSAATCCERLGASGPADLGDGQRARDHALFQQSSEHQAAARARGATVEPQGWTPRHRRRPRRGVARLDRQTSPSSRLSRRRQGAPGRCTGRGPTPTPPASTCLSVAACWPPSPAGRTKSGPSTTAARNCPPRTLSPQHPGQEGQARRP